MGKRLSKAFEKRLIGDYSFEPQVNKEDAEVTLNWAKEFVEEIKSYLVKERFM